MFIEGTDNPDAIKYNKLKRKFKALRDVSRIYIYIYIGIHLRIRSMGTFSEES